jgi:arylsulfatase A-like enzyme
MNPAKLVGLALLTLATWFIGPLAASQAHPNVLILFSDDHRADAVGYAPNPALRTTNLDRLAERGICLTRAHIMGAMQGAVCVPSRAMLMTSLGLFRVREDLAGNRTWPEQFVSAGYHTFMTGKWHNGPKSLARVFPNARSVFLGGMSDPYNSRSQDVVDGQLGPAVTNQMHHTELYATRAVQFLQAYTNTAPFFCYVAFKAPHDPRIGSPAWHQFYRTNSPPVPPNFLPEHPFDNGELKVRDEKLLPWPRSREAVRKEWEDYSASVSHLDEQIGRVLATLQARGFETNTLVVFAGDNGLALGSHGLLGKQNLYEHSTAVPLLLAGPGIAPRRSEALCYLQDVGPTLAELAGVEPLPEIDGLSLVPVIRGRQGHLRPVLFTAYRQVQRAVRTDKWKLIHYPAIDRWQLFDLTRDPFEQNDLSANEAFSDNLRSMRTLLQGQMRSAGDPLAQN